MTNYPVSSLKVTFQLIAHQVHHYRIWWKNHRWYWAALGNSGIEDTQEEAMRSAREYIMGIGKKPHGAS